MNYATLAPPITKENAAEYARRATAARERNRARRKQEILASPASYAQKEVEREINRVLQWMKKAESRKEHAALARTLDSLWSKAFPEVRATKPSIKRPPLPVAQHLWEHPELVREQAAPAPEPTPAPVAPPPAPEASPPPEPQPVPSSVSSPTSVPVPPMVVEVRNGLSLLFRRPAGVWTDAERRLLAEVARRGNVLTELQLIVNYRRRLSPEKRQSFPQSALNLLERWNEILTDARQHLPR